MENIITIEKFCRAELETYIFRRGAHIEEKLLACLHYHRLTRLGDPDVKHQGSRPPDPDLAADTAGD
ncbi:hypothetical protein NL676_020403 [Syzygium grande]|nr:hypothetical protein NL676_020403 [Syzygium grande]